MSRFVRPETRTLTLASGEWLIVRARLTAGEQRAHFARLYTTAADGRLQVNPSMVGLATVLAYLLDWNLTDDQGAIVAIRDASLEDLQRIVDSLDVESFGEIRTAIDTHEAAMLAERAAEKKTLTGGPAS